MYMYLYNGTWEAPQGSCFLVLHSKHVAEACVGSHLPMSLFKELGGETVSIRICLNCDLACAG